MKFLWHASRRPDVKRVTIFKAKRNKEGVDVTKFKIRTSKYLYTLTLPSKRAKVFFKIIPPGIKVLAGQLAPKKA